MIERGTIIWNELVTADQAKVGEFYSGLLGWTRKAIDAGPFGTYTIFQQDGKYVAGMMNPTKSDYEQASRPHGGMPTSLSRISRRWHNSP